MAKYIFNQDFKTGTYVPQGQGRPSVMVSFKKGDTIEGTFTHVEGQSESDFVATQTASGEVRIPFGGRSGTSPISVFSQTNASISDIGKKNSAPKSTTFFTPKNVIIGVLIIGSVLGGLKLLKVI